MNKKNNMAVIVLMTLFLILSGCGNQLGAPGSDNQGTGILINSISIAGSDAGSGDNEIDVAIHACPPAFTTFEDGLFIADATMTISASPSGFNDAFPASIEQCNMTYLKGNESPDAPIIESLTIYPNCILEDKKTNQCNVVLMDVDRKFKWWDDANAINFNHTYPTPYTVRYDCTYVNNYGKSGTFQIEYDIWLADWDNC